MLCLCFDNAAFTGHFQLNPFNFEQLDYLSLNVASQIFQSHPLKPDFENDECIRSYMTLFEGTGMLNDNRGHGITRDQF